MSTIPCRERVFLFKLTPWFIRIYSTYLHCLKYWIERLGSECILLIWQSAFQDYDDKLMMEILSGEWAVLIEDDSEDHEEQISNHLSDIFPLPLENVSKEEAQQLIETSPPVIQIRQLFPSLNVTRQMTAYEALHLRFDGLARLIETLIALHGKQGELIAYDFLREERILSSGGRTGSVAEFISETTSESDEPTLFTAGLDSEITRVSTEEVVWHIKECEWARYFQEHHPQVGYLIACSTDEVSFRAFNRDLRMQRTSTLMEGGDLCDFKVYAIEGRPNPNEDVA